MHSSQRLGAARVQLGLRVVGAGLLAAIGAIHLDLYTNGGFRHIPTIGWLFLLQVIAAFVLAVLQLVPGGRLLAALGAGFAVATLGGYLLSIWFGLFGFHEVRTTAGIVAGLARGGHVRGSRHGGPDPGAIRPGAWPPMRASPAGPPQRAEGARRTDQAGAPPLLAGR